MSKTKNIGVFVLGDLGHSPRMTFHALSLANRYPKSMVYFIGMLESSVHPEIGTTKNIRVQSLYHGIWSRFRTDGGFLRFLFMAPIKIILQMLVLMWVLLWKVPRLDVIIVQNPPSIPTLFWVLMLKILRRTVTIIDWHNFGYTILQMRRKGIIVTVAYWFERVFGKLSGTYHVCVSNGMRQFLHEKWGIDAIVMYDRPPDMFKPLTVEQQHNFWQKLEKHDKLETKFTKNENGHIRRKDTRLIVSSTSWTPDEDFKVLLDAFVMYERACSEEDLPLVHCIITGKGPQKEMYLEKIKKLNLQSVQISTAWLEQEDYPKLLACADLGVCMHSSSSGLDLPMKVVDMFGCGLPVCAMKFKTIKELVIHGENGLIFSDSTQLYEQIRQLLTQESELRRLKQHLQDHFQVHKWKDEWGKKLSSIFQKFLSPKSICVEDHPKITTDS